MRVIALLSSELTTELYGITIRNLQIRADLINIDKIVNYDRRNKKSINESAATAKKMAENNVDSVVVGLATKVVITALSGIATKGFSFINDDIKYKNMIDRTWEMLPLPIRLLGKDVINYDENMYFLRKQIFGKDKDEPEVDSADESIVSRTIKKMFS